MKPEHDYFVSEFMNKNVVEVTLDTPVRRCAEVMAVEKVSSAIIAEDNSLKGIVTEKDMCRKIVAKGLDGSLVLVKDVMTTDVETIDPDASLYDAMLKLNKRHIKHLPVVSDKITVGIITAMDILRVQPAYMEVLAGKNAQSVE